MSLIDALIGIFTDADSQEAYQTDPEGYLAQNGLVNVTSADVEAEMPRVLEAINGNQGGATQGGAADFSGSGNVTLPPPPAHAGGGGGYGGGDLDDGGLSGAIASINHYQNVVNLTEQRFEDNDVTTIDDSDTTVDSSVNQNMTVFGDVDQQFDNDVVSGDGAVAAGDGSQVNTGDGAVQAGDDIADSTIATGDVGGSVTGDVSDGIVGDGNQVIDDSTVGAASFGEGAATNVEADNAVLGDGTIVDGGEGDISFNQGDGDLTQISNSDIDESAIGDGGTVSSNDVDIDADDGSSVAFGEGSTSEATDQDVSVSDNAGTVQVGGDGDQTGVTDNSIDDSFDVSDSGNYSVEVTDNSTTDTFEATDSFTDDHSSVDTDVDVDQTTTTIEDNDGIDAF
jgi:hypothetical protein